MMPFVDQLLGGYAAEGKPMLVTKSRKAADDFTRGWLYEQAGWTTA